jgi:hypothetical protein
MANLAASGVTITRSYLEKFPSTEQRVLDVSIVLSSMGTVANNIPATSFGLARFYGPVVLVKSDNSVILVGTPSADGTLLLLLEATAAAGTNAPADFSGTYVGQVKGY